MATNNPTNNPKEDKKSNNHFTVTIRKQNEEIHAKTKKLCEDLGCSMGDVVWYSLSKMFETKSEPKQFGLR